MRRHQMVRIASELALGIILLIVFGFSKSSPKCRDEGTDWSQFAYVQYATNSDYLCNSVMLFEMLHRLGSKADRLMLVPSQFGEKNGWILDLLLKVRDEYNVRLKLIEIQLHGDDCTY
jgi:hypothetical protein